MSPSPPAAAAVRIIVDEREIPSGTSTILSGMEGVEIVVRRLDLGDYLIDDSLIVERKTLLDLVGSIKDGRFFRQVCRLVSARARGVLILEGVASEMIGCEMRREAIQGALIAATVILGIAILRSTGPEESARLMVYAGRQARSRVYSHGSLRRFIGARRPDGKTVVQTHMLQGIPGIGPARARGLLNHFGSIEAIATADVDELSKVAEIGPHTARMLRWAVSERGVLYSSEPL
ncbi:MAG: nuclease [Planctomycetes bacterium]|nr:nuclease [Planctomycetota bacterium]